MTVAISSGEHPGNAFASVVELVVGQGTHVDAIAGALELTRIVASWHGSRPIVTLR
jgi:hypothetical protein